MKKNDILAIVGLLLMFLKSNLFLVEGTPLYFYTNIIGALFFISYLFIQKRTKFIFPTILYITFNLILKLTESYQLQILPMGSGLFLTLDLSLFLFPIIAFLYYLSGFDGEEKPIKLLNRLMMVSLVFALIGGFTLLTGVFLFYSLIVVSLITMIVLILETIALLYLIIYFFQEGFYKELTA